MFLTSTGIWAIHSWVLICAHIWRHDKDMTLGASPLESLAASVRHSLRVPLIGFSSQGGERFINSLFS